MSNKLLNVLISTYGKGIENINLPKSCDGVGYIIIHQNPDNVLWQNDSVKRDDVKYILTRTVGLSKSRNIAINNADAKYAYIMDDDVEIKIDIIKIACDYFDSLEADVLTFKIITPTGEDFKKYSKKCRRVNKLSAARVSSIEICFRVDKIKNKISFNESFGLGTDLPSGEEYIFLSDCLNHHLSVFFLPINTVVHENISSGRDFFSSKEKIRAKRKMIEHVFNKKALIFNLFFFLKKLPCLIEQKRVVYFFKEFFL